MDTSLIKPFAERLSGRNERGSFLSAVLFGAGELVRVENDFRVYGLILAGYEGHHFGDDGTFTATVASELPLERWDGVHALEEHINKGVQELNPPYVAEHVGFIPVDEAAVLMQAYTKSEFGLKVPSEELRWSTGSLTLS